MDVQQARAIRAFAPFEVVFTETGPLGVSFTNDSNDPKALGPTWVLEIVPGGQAASFQKLMEGMTLLSVNGVPTKNLEHAMEMIDPAVRPMTLLFAYPEWMKEAEQAKAMGGGGKRKKRPRKSKKRKSKKRKSKKRKSKTRRRRR
tara:strand:- start:294 stop:728 length:435 start_codon:yes stop_codon:yes gene_type:complete